MHQVTARANPGTLVQLDQCQKCGGIWCDKWELFPVDPDEAERLDTVSEPLFTAPVALPKRSLYCPRCTAPLQLCQDPVLPPELILERCLRCDGIWLNRGKLTRYKRHQRKVQVEKLGADAIIRKIPEVYDNPQSWVVTGTQGMMAYPSLVHEAGEDFRPSPRGIIKLILQSLLRLALGV